MNPFDLSGPAFLWFFLVAGGIAAIAAIVLRWLVARPLQQGDPEEIARALHPTEVAFLARDLDRAVEAAVAGLHHRGAIELEGSTLRRIDRPGAPEPDGVYRGTAAAEGACSAVEAFVLSRLPATMSQLCEDARGSQLAAELGDKLEAEGLLVDRASAGWLVMLPGLAWIATGAIKMAVGISRDRPIGLLFLMLLAGGALFLIFARAPRLTWLGRAVRRELESNAALETTARTAPQQLSGTEMSLAYALFGYGVAPAALIAVMPSFHAEVAALSSGGGGSSCGSSSGCSSSSSSSSSDSGSSGGSSCGGGGGGGCGGCGGGGGGCS